MVMKVTKWVEFSKEIEVEISGEEAVAAITDDPDGVAPELHLKRAVSSFFVFLKHVPDLTIANLTPEARKTIHKGLTEQVDRFKVKEEDYGASGD
jgi:hypothetical protein